MRSRALPADQPELRTRSVPSNAFVRYPVPRAAVLAAFFVLLAPQAAAVDPAIRAHAERRCMADALYFEAGEEGREGMLAVAEVILRRKADRGFPGTVCRVVYQGQFERVCQFSFACDGARVRPRARALWRAAWTISGEVMADPKAVLAADRTQGALYFHADYVDPGWEGAGLARTVQVGRHIFYRRGEQGLPGG